MPTTIKQGFERLRTNLEISDLQEQTVSTRQYNVRDAVKDQLVVLDSFLTGSYRRSTMIAPLTEADIDIFVVLSSEYFEQNGQTRLLDKVKQALRRTYKTPDISRNGQAVTILFNDFHVDVVPSFYREGGGYLIPDSIGSRWISTDPRRHVELWSASNAAHNGDLVPMLKMIKRWNITRGARIRSFHLECAVREILTNVTISNFWSGVRYFFGIAKDRIYVPIYDPAGYGGDVGAYLSLANRLAVAAEMSIAYNLALDAEQLDNAGRIEEAFGKWRGVFGDYFPAYS